jgi:hypothetical protein
MAYEDLRIQGTTQALKVSLGQGGGRNNNDGTPKENNHFATIAKNT